MTAARYGQSKDGAYSQYTDAGVDIQATNRFDSPAPLRLVSVEKEREVRLKLTDMEFGDLEALARIDLGPEERDRLRLQLGRILGFVRKLQEVDAGEQEETGPALTGRLITASDEPGECLEREEVLGQAPDREDGFFRVPPVIDREGGAGS
jgi:aspartyl-tRNA(Asn)/glutamyl-tRNA(Gln) amidotransferase subunit C